MLCGRIDSLKEKRINKALMREGKVLTLDRYKVLGQAIVKELERIIFG